MNSGFAGLSTGAPLDGKLAGGEVIIGGVGCRSRSGVSRVLRTLCFALFAALTLSGCFLLGPGGDFVTPEVRLTNLYFKNATLFETLLVCTVRIDNENPDEVNLDGATLKLYLNDLYVGKGFMKEAVSISRYSSEEAEVEVALSNLTMLSRIVPIVESPEFSYRIDSSIVLGSPYNGSRVESSTSDSFSFTQRR